MRQESLLKDQSSTAKFLPTWSQIKTELVKSRRKVKKIRTGDPQFWWTALLWLLSLQFSKDFCGSKILTIVLFLIPDLLFTVSFEMNYIIILLNFGTSVHHITENENPLIYTSDFAGVILWPTFSPAKPDGPDSPSGPDLPLGPSGPSSPLGPCTPPSPLMQRKENETNDIIVAALSCSATASIFFFVSISEVMIYLVTLETHVTFKARESILSLKMKEGKKHLWWMLSVLSEILHTFMMLAFLCCW